MIRTLLTSKRHSQCGCFLMIVGCLLGTPTKAASKNFSAEQWPAADVLFKRDSRWRGADAANSIDLGNGRVLWTFGDTFISQEEDPAQRSRLNSVMINNSVAIQTGYDPTHADFQPYWQTTSDDKPASFFRAVGDVFYWPGGGLLVDGKLLIFLMRVQTADTELHFKIVGWGAVLVDNPQDEPSVWRMQFFDFDHAKHDIMVGNGGAIRCGDWVYVYGANADHADRGAELARFLVTDLLRGDFSRPQWWNADRCCWQNESQLCGAAPPAIFKPGAPEFSVHCDQKPGKYVALQLETFPVGPIVARTAPCLTGPWSASQEVFRPEEMAHPEKGLMLYAVKAHPEQQAEGLAVTYNSNNSNVGWLMGNESRYYPRFVLVKTSER